MLRVKRKSYMRRGGVRVRSTIYKTPDKGKRGRTPKAKQWYPKVVKPTGWAKNLPATTRRRRLITSQKDPLKAGRWALSLANLTTDKPTEKKARADSRYFFSRVKKR